MPDSGTLYAIGAHGTSWVKIGYTHGDVDTRLKALQVGHPQPLRVIGTVRLKINVRQVEQQVHALLVSVKRRGEWFDLPMNEAMLKAMVARVMPEPIGAHIRRARLAAGMSQAVLSRRIGISTTAMNDLEQGRTADPRLSHVVAIADTLRLSVDTLLGREVPHADA